MLTILQNVTNNSIEADNINSVVKQSWLHYNTNKDSLSISQLT